VSDLMAELADLTPPLHVQNVAANLILVLRNSKIIPHHSTHILERLWPHACASQPS
jgi:hypothetical protein